jgi:hypothetical protein
VDVLSVQRPAPTQDSAGPTFRADVAVGGREQQDPAGEREASERRRAEHERAEIDPDLAERFEVALGRRDPATGLHLEWPRPASPPRVGRHGERIHEHRSLCRLGGVADRAAHLLELLDDDALRPVIPARHRDLAPPARRSVGPLDP